MWRSRSVDRPQPWPSARFVLDVHLGTLAATPAARMDTAYANDLDDDVLVERRMRNGGCC